MTVNYKIKATIVDIRSDNPNIDDIFIVDTNVWYWVTYGGSKLVFPKPLSYQTKYYPTYIKKAIRAKAKIFICRISFFELINLIENNEWKIYCSKEGLDNKLFKLKEYRHNTYERNVVGKEIQSAINSIKTMATPIDSMVDEPFTTHALDRVSTQLLDAGDLFMLARLPLRQMFLKSFQMMAIFLQCQIFRFLQPMIMLLLQLKLRKS